MAMQLRFRNYLRCRLQHEQQEVKTKVAWMRLFEMAGPANPVLTMLPFPIKPRQILHIPSLGHHESSYGMWVPLQDKSVARVSCLECCRPYTTDGRLESDNLDVKGK